MRFSRRRQQANSAASDVSRVIAWGDQLAKVHRWLLAELAAAREQLGQSQSGIGGSPLLQAHCVSFCDALDAHHDGEDDGMFPHLETVHPALRSVIEQLRREHVRIARIVRDVRDLLDDPGSADAETQLSTRFDELTAELREHFAFEERQLTDTLNAMERLPWHNAK